MEVAIKKGCLSRMDRQQAAPHADCGKPSANLQSVVNLLIMEIRESFSIHLSAATRGLQINAEKGAKHKGPSGVMTTSSPGSKSAIGSITVSYKHLKDLFVQFVEVVDDSAT